MYMMILSFSSCDTMTYASVSSYDDAYVNYEIVWVDNWPYYWYGGTRYVPYYHNHPYRWHPDIIIERRPYRPYLRNNRFDYNYHYDMLRRYHSHNNYNKNHNNHKDNRYYDSKKPGSKPSVRRDNNNRPSQHKNTNINRRHSTVNRNYNNNRTQHQNNRRR